MNRFFLSTLFIFLIKFSIAQFTVVSWPPIPNTYNDFENVLPGAYATATAIPGWSISSGTNPSPAGIGCSGTPSWTPGSPEFSIVTTPIFGNPYYGAPNVYSIDNVNIGHSPIGGTQVVRMHDVSAGNLATRMQITFSVTNANTMFEVAYCGSWHTANHTCCDRPAFTYRLLDAQGNAVNCYSANLSPVSASCSAGPAGNTVGEVTWLNWQHEFIDLTPFFGSVITIEFINSDCNTGGHHGSVYLDIGLTESVLFGCPNMGINPPQTPVSFCSTSTVATITAPPGYQSYSWTAPANATLVPASSSLQVVTISNPIPGDVYTVTATYPIYYVGGGNCSVSYTYALAPTQVSIAAVGVAPSCSIGASGSSTVFSAGSGTGYNYTWLNQSNAVVGTNSVITNLLPGVYNVSVSALGVASCGSAITSVTIGVIPNNFLSVIEPFCGNTATLDLPPTATSVQWYTNNQPISAALGGTASVYTVNQASNLQIFRTGYNTTQGCRDSVQFTLAQASSGSFSVSNISMACQGASNATANLVINPSPMAFSTMRSYSLFSIPAANYTSTASSYTTSNFAVAGMPLGNYSVVASDGLCSYTSSFSVSEFIFDGLVSPSSTICSGANALLGVLFPNPISPSQYSFSWSPNTNVQGAINSIAILVTNTSIPNPALTVYSVVVTPTIVNCPTTQTVGINFLYSPTPTISPLQPICANNGIYTLTATPGGGTFSAPLGGNWLSSSGLVTSSQLFSPGTYSVIYTAGPANCNYTTTSTINVSTLNVATLTNPLLSTCSTASCINLMSVAQNTNGIWAGTNIVSNSFCPSNNPTGIYTFTYTNASVPNPTACPQSSTLAINIQLPTTPTISSAGPFCNSFAAVQLSASPAQGSFVPSAYLSSSGLFTPTLSTIGSNLIQYTGLCLNTATTFINVEAFTSADFITGISPFCQNSTPSNLASIALNPGGTWSGNGMVGSIFNPALAGPGTWIITHSINSLPTNACPSQYTFQAVVNPTPNLSIQGSSIVCLGQSNVLQASGASSYLWSGSTLPNPVLSYSISISPSVSTVYYLNGVDNLGCIGQVTFPVSVIPCYVGIKTIAFTDSSINLFPNPSHGIFYLQCESKTKLSISDALGRVLLANEVEAGEHSIDLSLQANGIYFLNCHSSNNAQVIKLIKE